MEKEILFSHLETPVYHSFLRECRKMVTDYLCSRFLYNSPTERLVIQISIILQILLDKEEGARER